MTTATIEDYTTSEELLKDYLAQLHEFSSDYGYSTDEVEQDKLIDKVYEVERKVMELFEANEKWWVEHYIHAHKSSPDGFEASREMSRRGKEFTETHKVFNEK